jgi:glycosyltransferase involved in cell wall biosynthesis
LVQRIVFVIPTLDRSGAEKQLMLLATGLPRDEFEPHVVTLTRGGPYAADLQAAGVPIHPIDKRWKLDLGALGRLRRLLRDLQPAIVQSWLFAGNAYARFALGKHPRCRVIVSERCVDSWKSGWQLQIDRWLINRTDCLVGNSASVAAFYEEQGFPPARIRVIPNAVIPPNIDPQRRQFLRKQLDLPENAFLAGFVGRIAPQKRLQDLLFAVETLRHIRPVYLAVLGDGPERQRMVDFAEAIHCPDNVRFLGHREDAVDWYSAFDAFCLPSSFEGMSNSLMEAMAAGLPVLVSDIPPNKELVTHDVDGYHVKTGDPTGYAQFLRKLIDEPATAQRLGQSARSKMLTDYSVAAMLERYAALYREHTNA